MSSELKRRYRVGVRPAPSNRRRYLWTIDGTEVLFHEESSSDYASVEQALADANARLSELS